MLDQPEPDVLTFGFFHSLRIVSRGDGEFERAIHQTCVAPRHPPEDARHSPGDLTHGHPTLLKGPGDDSPLLPWLIRNRESLGILTPVVYTQLWPTVALQL
jgi:hypothetical protein